MVSAHELGCSRWKKKDERIAREVIRQVKIKGSTKSQSFKTAACFWGGSALLSLCVYIGVCLATGRLEAWDDERMYAPLLFSVPVILAFLSPRHAVITGLLFSVFQSVGWFIWTTAKNPQALPWWPMLIFTFVLFVFPVVFSAVLFGAGLRVIGGRLLKKHSSR